MVFTRVMQFKIWHQCQAWNHSVRGKGHAVACYCLPEDCEHMRDIRKVCNMG